MRPSLIAFGVAIVLSSVLLLSSCSKAPKRAEPTGPVLYPDEVLFDDFDGTAFDSANWEAAKRNWGGTTVNEDGVTEDYNGGVLPENISVRDGKLILTGHGDRYEGDTVGICRDGSPRKNGKRTGACLVTKKSYASGSYEVYGKISPELGSCSAIWTFDWFENPATGHIDNHEIDIEIPGHPLENPAEIGFDYALCNTWIGEQSYETQCSPQHFENSFADGKFHHFRFDWHTGDAERGESPRVDFYFDGELVCTNTEFIPTNAGQLWLGLWFPNQWAGVPDFDTSAFEIDWVRISPFHEAGDSSSR